MAKEGKVAPRFTVTTDDGTEIKLADLKGKIVILYFYPKDDTSGCTKEALAFTELMTNFNKLGAEVIGISPDSVASHKKFKEKYNLTVVLGSDEDKAIVEKYGVWVEKQMYGRKYMGVERTTFLIDKQGKVERIWRKVKIPGHAEEVLDAVKGLASETKSS